MSSESLLSHEDDEHYEQPSVEQPRTMEARSEHQKTKMYSTIYTFTTALGVGLLIMILFWILHFRGGFAWQTLPKQQFYWHPFLMVLSLVFLYSQSILVYRTGRQMQKRNLKLMHASIHMLAFIFSVIGLKAAFDSHNLVNPPIPNLYSLHSWLGLIAVIIFAGQYVFGFTAFLYPGVAMSIRKAVLPIHVVIGTSGFVLAIGSTLTGLTEKVLWTLGGTYGSLPAEGFLFNFIGLITAIYGLLVIYLVNETIFKRHPLPEEDIALSRTE